MGGALGRGHRSINRGHGQALPFGFDVPDDAATGQRLRIILLEDRLAAWTMPSFYTAINQMHNSIGPGGKFAVVRHHHNGLAGRVQ